MKRIRQMLFAGAITLVAVPGFAERSVYFTPPDYVGPPTAAHNRGLRCRA